MSSDDAARSQRRLEALGRHVLGTRGASAAAASPLPDVVTVLITGAAGQIGYSLIPLVCNGLVFGAEQRVELRLLDIAPARAALDGVVLEICDCAYPLLHRVVATTDVREAFTGVNVALLVGAFPRRPGMLRRELLQRNAGIFLEQGRALAECAAPDVRAVVVGNPANTNAWLLARAAAPRVPPERITALTRLDQDRATYQVAARLGVDVSAVRNVVIWGNHSATQVPDVNAAVVADYPRRGLVTPVAAALAGAAGGVHGGDAWIRDVFIPAVQTRGAAVLRARKLSSAASAANAIARHVRAWMLGTAPGEIVSMAVPSDGAYGVPRGIVFSFPVTCRPGGHYDVVRDLGVAPDVRARIDTTTAELLQERATALTVVDGSGDGGGKKAS